ncbi:MAG: hypothetical protein N4J56_004408 [Chroococcidiopsis sp. SAG 2025]|nr:hypothetical protein [Chroococcidiopsis sp. SAG 2025]
MIYSFYFLVAIRALAKQYRGFYGCDVSNCRAILIRCSLKITLFALPKSAGNVLLLVGANICIGAFIESKFYKICYLLADRLFSL